MSDSPAARLHPGLADTLAAVRAAGATTSLCSQYDSNELWDGIGDLCAAGLLDVVFVNEDEAAGISGHPGALRCAALRCAALRCAARYIVLAQSMR